MSYNSEKYIRGLKLILYLGITLLQGRTNYGDSIEDEWVIVYFLRELTKRHKDIWVKVMDSDGEFLLIEAAGTLPAWIEPDVADNRVCGVLHHQLQGFYAYLNLQSTRFGSTRETSELSSRNKRPKDKSPRRSPSQKHERSSVTSLVVYFARQSSKKRPSSVYANTLSR